MAEHSGDEIPRKEWEWILRNREFEYWNGQGLDGRVGIYVIAQRLCELKEVKKAE